MLRTEESGEAGMCQNQRVHLDQFVIQVFIKTILVTPPVGNVVTRMAPVIGHLVMMTPLLLTMSSWKFMEGSVLTWIKSTCLEPQMVGCSFGHVLWPHGHQNWQV